MSKIKDRTGEWVKTANEGWAKIEIYRNAKDIDVRFDKYRYLRHTTYAKFKSGNIAPETSEWVTNIDGRKMKIAKRYEDNPNAVMVQFEDGQLVYTDIYTFNKRDL